MLEQHGALTRCVMRRSIFHSRTACAGLVLETRPTSRVARLGIVDRIHISAM